MAKSRSSSGCTPLLILLIVGAGAGLYFLGGDNELLESIKPGESIPEAGEIAPPDKAPAAPASAKIAPPKAEAVPVAAPMREEDRAALELAERLKKMAEEQGVDRVVMTWSAGGLGAIPGRFRLGQIVEGDMAIVETIQAPAGTPQTFLLMPAPYDKADGDELSLAKAACRYLGRRKYSTIFGDSNQLDTVELIDTDLVAWADEIGRLSQQRTAMAAAERAWLDEVSSAKQALDEARKGLSALRSEDPKMEAYLRTKSRVDMYARVAALNERAAAAHREGLADLEKLGPVDEAKVKDYAARRQALSDQLREAGRQLAKARAAKPF